MTRVEQTQELQDVKDLLIRLIEIPQDDRRNIFGGANFKTTLLNFTFDQIKERLDGYEESRKEVVVGDVLCFEEMHAMAIVTSVTSWGFYVCLVKGGGTITIDESNRQYWKKTGRNVSDKLEGLWNDLKQEPCEDCISRAQALSDYADWYGYGYRDNTFYKHLKDMPPATPKKRWIPVSEKLPEKPFGCLVTVEEDDIHGEPHRVIYPDFVGYDGETWNDADGEVIPFEVTAWMPLPKPFEPEESDEGKE